MKNDKFDLICDTINDWQGSLKDLAAQFTEEDYQVIFNEAVVDCDLFVDTQLVLYYYGCQYWEEFLAMFIRNSLASLIVNGEAIGLDNLFRLWKETLD